MNDGITRAAYEDAIARARTMAIKDGCAYYVRARLIVVNGIPCIERFMVTEWHDGSCLCRVTKNQTFEV